MKILMTSTMALGAICILGMNESATAGINNNPNLHLVYGSVGLGGAHGGAGLGGSARVGYGNMGQGGIGYGNMGRGGIGYGNMGSGGIGYGNMGQGGGPYDRRNYGAGTVQPTIIINEEVGEEAEYGVPYPEYDVPYPGYDVPYQESPYGASDDEYVD